MIKIFPRANGPWLHVLFNQAKNVCRYFVFFTEHRFSGLAIEAVN